MFRIQLPYGVVEDNTAKIKLNLRRNYGAGEYFKKLPYLNVLKTQRLKTLWSMLLIIDTTSANSC